MYEEKEPVKKAPKERKIKKFFHDSKLKSKVKTSKKEKQPREKKKISIKKTEVKETTQNLGKTKILGFKPDFVSILIKFGIFLFIAFIVIFVVTKIRMGSDRKSFTENMEKMKEVAYTYFKAEKNRPALVDDEIDISLDDMIKGSLIKELKDKKGNVCSRDYSYVTMVKENDTDYKMTVYLSCAGEAQESNYNITYQTPSKDSLESKKTMYYELQRTITTEDSYRCPSGYTLNGKYCEKDVSVIAATPIYKVTPEKNTKAAYKSSKNEYEYAETLVTTKENVLKCQSGYHLENGKCVKEIPVKYKTEYTYSCPNGGTPSGTKCLFRTGTDYTDQKAYCQTGRLINEDECYVTKDYSYKCLTGMKDSSKHTCYTTYSARKELSDWMFDSKVKYSTTKDVSKLNSDTVRYEYDYYDEYSKKDVYKRYIRKNIKVCDDDDVLSGSQCKHYDSSYINKYCTGDYELTSDGNECYTIKSAKYKTTKGTYKCPVGYTKVGTGDNATCTKYEKATKTSNKTPYCSFGYELTKDNRCVKTMSAIVVDEENYYSCPSGYIKSGSGSKTKCYKKTKREAYYYCANTSATLQNDRCITPSTTKFVSYRCPSGYKLSGNQCLKSLSSKERIEATKTEGTSKTETIWNKDKELDGWTWTGNTKEE